MRKLIDINPLKRETREKFNLLRASEGESRVKSFFKNYGKLALKLLAALIILIFLWKLAANFSGFKGWKNFSKIDPNKWQVVFLSNSQTYFGHILEMNRDFLILDKVYYFKAVPGSQDSQQLNLTRLSDEIYRPEDIMHIPKNQITFWQDLRDDSQVTRILNQSEEANK